MKRESRITFHASRITFHCEKVRLRVPSTPDFLRTYQEYIAEGGSENG